MSREAATIALERHLESSSWSNQTESRRHLLEAFLRLATVNGFNSVTMRMIAKEVNIKAPSIYAHFPDGRDEIVAESLRWHFYQFGTALLDAVRGTETADEYWDAMVRLHFVRQVQLPESNLWDLLVATDRMVHVLPDGLRSQVDEWLSLYEDMYVAAAAELGYPNAHAQLKVVMTVLEGATRWSEVSGTEANIDSEADRAVVISRSLLRLSF